MTRSNRLPPQLKIPRSRLAPPRIVAPIVMVQWKVRELSPCDRQPKTCLPHAAQKPRSVSNKPTIGIHASVIADKGEINRCRRCSHGHINKAHAMVQFKLLMVRRLEKLAKARGVVHRWNKYAVLEVANRCRFELLLKDLPQARVGVLCSEPKSKQSANQGAVIKNPFSLFQEKSLQFFGRHFLRQAQCQKSTCGRSAYQVEMLCDRVPESSL